MKTKPTSKSAFFSLRVLTGFSLCIVGVFVTLIAFAKPSGNVVARQDQPHQLPAQLEVAAGDNLAIYDAQLLPESRTTDQIAQQSLPVPDTSWLQAPSQATSCSLTVLPTDGSSSANARAPSTRFAGARGHYLITAAELSAAGFPNGTTPTFLGWTYFAAPVTGGSAPLIIYMQNTADTTNTKSLTWATAITGMTIVHSAATALPSTVGPFDITFTGGAPFTYTGGGLYIAYDWGNYAGTLSTTASVSCNTALINGLASANSQATTVAFSNFRPETRISSFAANNAAVQSVRGFGEVPLGLAPPQIVSGVVANHGFNALTNLPVTLNVTGANTFSNGQSIASLSSCTGSGTATFSGFTPTAAGANTLTVSVPADDVAGDNSRSRPFNVTSVDYSYKHPGTTANGGVGVNGSTAALIARFNTLAANAVTAVKLEFPNAVPTTAFRVAIYAESAPGSGTPATAPIFVDAADRPGPAAGPVTITLPAAVPVGPGNFFVGIQQTNTVNVGLSFDTENPIRSGSFFLAIPTGSAFFDEAPGNNFKLNIGLILQTPGPSPSPTPIVSTPTPTATPPPITPTPPPPSATPSASPSTTPCGSSTTFSNTAAITINDAGVAAPYPSNITVSGVTNPVTKVTVTLTGFNHTFPSDVDVLVVGPGGQKFILVSDVIGGTDAVAINWIFDDAAAAFIGSTGTPASGTFKPTNYTTCQDPFAAPAPAGAYLTPGGIGTPCGTDTLAAFNGVDANGTWSLYVVDDLGADVGTITGGWSVTITGSGAGCPSPTPSASPTPGITPTPGTPSPTPSCPPVITQSSTQTITPLNSVSCNNGTGHTDNSYWRAFNMTSFVGSVAYNVTSVSFGIEQATGAGGTQPITVRLHTSNQPFPTGFPGSLTQIATATVNVPDSASNTIFTVPIAATVPAGAQLVMEVFTPDGTVAGNLLFMGSNADPESGPSYLSAAACGITTPTTTAAIGFPTMHLVFNVIGGCGPVVSPTPGITATPGITPTPSATATPCSGGTDVIVDGGFENGGIPSSNWDPETSTNFGTPLCDFASCGNGGGASPPRTGLIWAWFGGIAATETATLGQTVVIPSGGSATLHFFMRIGTVTTPFTDVMNVRVDGAIVQSFVEPATAETDYTERVINLNAFANGASHAILFEYIGPTSGTGSYVIDDVSLIAGGACPSATPSIPPPSATPTATTSPSCAPSWSGGPAFPDVGGVRAPGNFFPANGRFYSIGGRNADVAGADFTHPFEYNPGTNAWTTKPSTIPDGKVNNMACGVLTVSGTAQIYCVGGSQSQVVGTVGRVFSYNPATDTFATLTAADDWPGSQTNTFLPGGFAVAGNKLYIIGSFNANATPPVMTNQVWQFDPTAAVGSKWVAQTNYPQVRGYVPAATIGGKIYTGGGSALDVTGALIDSVESFVFDPAVGAGGTWAALPNIPRATGETRAVVMGTQMWVLGGGRTAPNPSNQVNIYDPGTNAWTTGLPFSTARRNFPADSDGTHIYLAGGYDSSGTTLLNTMEIFGPGPCGSPSPTPPTTPTPTPPPTTPSPTPPPATPTPTPPTGTPTPTPTPPTTPTPGVSPPAQAVNFSTRMHVEGGDRVGIGGFIVQGLVPKRLIVRAIGPSLTRQGLTDVLADPVLELHGPGSFVTITNDNWRDTQEAEIQATGLPPTNNFESAIVATLPPGNYTAIVRAGPSPLARTGLALVEVYDLNQDVGKLANISTRAFCGTNDNVIIAGFILGNHGGDDQVIARGMGPSLTAQGVPNVLADPTLQLRNANGALISSNNDWQDNPAQAAIISAAGLAPGNDLESAIAATLPPGLYTALLAGFNPGSPGSTGNALVEVYDCGDGCVGGPVPTPTPGVTPVPTPSPSPGAPTPTPPPASPTPPPASPTPPAVFTENFDGVTAPDLPPGWTVENAPVDGSPTPHPPTGAFFVTSTASPAAGTNCAFVVDQGNPSDKRLISPNIAITTSGANQAVLTFQNKFNMELSDQPYDGGVLEVSSPNINAGAFTDVTDAAVGGSIPVGDYTGVIDCNPMNDTPLRCRNAWTGISGGGTTAVYITSEVHLGTLVNGQTIKLRFRAGSDDGTIADPPDPGWRIDSLSLVGGVLAP